MRIGNGNLRPAFRAMLAMMLLGWTANPVAANDLYRTRSIVTGQGEENRLVGFAACLEDVLIKVSGAIRLAGDSRLLPYKSVARDFVLAYDYRDQKGGRPKNDEQGTRDRSFDLIVEFDEKRIDAVLLALGVKPWLSRRPVLGVFVEMEQGARKYAVTADSAQTDLPRAALAAAADKRGMSILLPDIAMLERLGCNCPAPVPYPALAEALSERGAEVLVLGRLIWSDAELMWRAEWRLEWQGQSHEWSFAAITFDEAFRRGLGEAAQIVASQP